MPEPAFKPCALVPVFNHQHRIDSVVRQLLEHRVDCILVDDGSDADCAAALDEVAQRYPEAVTLLRLQENQGKGAAVCHGLYHAYEKGYSHALQVDADGQHDLADVPRFLQAAQSQPRAVISGARRYRQMPKDRRFGRMLTDFWVCVHTLSWQVHDSMCGYRLYPLQDTVNLLERRKVGSRMDFDTDIMVRLYWQGLDVKNLPTAIVYHRDIASHFNLVKDNLRIVLMHTKLFFGMLVRCPSLLSRHWRR